MKFPVLLTKDEETGIYVAVCAVLRGCVSQGETKEKALESIKEAIELCLQFTEEEKLAAELGAELEWVEL